MAFDISTAKPIEEQVTSGFDISTAKPIEEETAQSESLGGNLLKDVIETGKGLVPGMGQAVSNVGKMGMDVMLGSSVRDYLGQGRESNNPVISAINEPAIKNIARETQSQAIAEEPKYNTLEKAKETMYKHPISNIPMQAAMMAAPTLLGKKAIKPLSQTEFIKAQGKALKKVGGTSENVLQMMKENPELSPKVRAFAESKGYKVTPKQLEKVIRGERESVDTAELLPIKLEKTQIQNLAKNKFLQDKIGNFTGAQAAEYADTAATLTKEVKPGIRKAQNEFYKELGIKDSDLLNATEAQNKILDIITEGAKYVDERAIKNATALFDDISKKPEIDFGTVKKNANIAYDLAEANVNNIGRKTPTGKFFTDIGNSLTKLKHTDPRISKASAKFAELLEAEKLINKTLRASSEMGEMSLDKKILASHKDKGFLDTKRNLARINDILSKYPETKQLVKKGGFNDMIQLAQLAQDISLKKTTNPVGFFNRFGLQALGNVLKVGDPAVQAQLLVKGIKSGRINPEAVAGMSKDYPGIMFGGLKTKVGALKDILTFPKGRK